MASMVALCSGAFLLLASYDGIVGSLSATAWLATICILSICDIGAAFGLYIGAVALFSPRHFDGWGTPFQRPDNYALPFLVVGIILTRLKRPSKRTVPRFGVLILTFIVYGLVQITVLGIANRAAVAWFMRTYGTACFSLLFWWAWPRPADLRRFASVLTFVAAYMALVSVIESLRWDVLIVPTWITNPAINLNMEETFGAGRAGGLLMQSEWNGAVLSLLSCIAVASAAIGNRRFAPVKWIAYAACLVATYVTYTRGAWLAVGTALLCLMIQALRAQPDKRKALLILLAVVAAAAVVGAMPNHRASQRLGDSDNIYFRLYVWEAGLRMAAARPVFGYGFAQFSQQAPSYLEDASSLPTATREEGTVAHNVFMNLLAEEGLVGLTLYLGFVIILIRSARRSAVQLWGARGAVWVTAFVAAYYVNMQFIAGSEPTKQPTALRVVRLDRWLQPFTPTPAPPRLARCRQLNKNAVRLVTRPYRAV